MHALAVPMRERVERLERALERVPQLPADAEFHFGPGVAYRVLRLPAGAIATGAVHRTAHDAIVVGHCLLTTDEGAREFIGVNIVHSEAGAKRAIGCISDCVVITVHVTDETDPARLVELLTESKASELAGGADNRQLQLSGRVETLQ